MTHEKFEEKYVSKYQNVIPEVVEAHRGNIQFQAIKAYAVLSGQDLKKLLEPNIAILINHGVSKSMVMKIFMSQPRSLLLPTHRFTEVVEEAEKLGFDPTTMNYLLAVRSLAMSKSLWE
ncbi:hypothetical protein Vadar_034240 [Vaccinium darrowii]|uniref:Uncharacterized protein n=1 Tax=Vaccinium darrowii TaxID=229202 RepID=A0ACB7Z1E7_9ERIC|nr:hypothetical protein Vadar_034240 [Vaccinium darrowii]